MKAIFSVVLLNLFALLIIVRAGVDSGAAHGSPKDSEGFLLKTIDSQEDFTEGSTISRTSRNLVRRDIDPIDDDSELSHLACEDLDSLHPSLARWATKVTNDPNSRPVMRFYFASRRQQSRVEIATGNKFSLCLTDFKPERRTFMLVHGYRPGINRIWIQEMEKALLEWGDVNIILVDWGTGDKEINYYDAFLNTREAGQQIARFLHQVANATKYAFPTNTPKLGELHLIGYSLGAHVSGIAAHELKKLTDDWRVQRITGLDPASICFRDVNLQYRLDAADADYVDIIHTSATTNTTLGFGIWERLGHVDYYVNGGHTQPGCESRAIYQAHRKLRVEIAKCSHHRSYNYFIESLMSVVENGCTYWGIRWNTADFPNHPPLSQSASCTENDCSPMGIRSEDYPYRGTFYVHTGWRPPYCSRFLPTGGKL